MKRFLFIISFFLLSVLSVQAQDKILVTGEITNKANGEPLNNVRVYAYNTVAEGNDAYNEALSYFKQQMDWATPKDHIALSDPGGVYTINSFPSNGSLLFYLSPYEPVFIRINGKNKINVKIEATQQIEQATLTADGGKAIIEDETYSWGDEIRINKPYFFDMERMGEVEKLGKTNARLVAQMFVINAKEENPDTVQYYPPMIYDGEQFHKTQVLWSPDTLYSSAGNFEDVTNTLEFTGVFLNKDKANIYFAKAHVWVEDFIGVYYSDTIEVMNTGRLKRPFDFLEYSFGESHVDKHRYFKQPRIEQVDDSKDLSLKFQENSAELNMKDEKTAQDISELKALLKEINDNPAATLKELHVNGYASPDGNFSKNQDLSDRRTNTVRRELQSVLSRSVIDRLYTTGKGHVAPWTDLADLLERDSLKIEADAVREIVDKFPGNIDQQGTHVKKLPYYYTLIAPRLDELRTVKCVYNFEVFRTLEPHEILEKYNSDKSFRDGTQHMTLNEYWYLFELVKDESQLEELYKRALATSIKVEKKPWPLPANLLAVSYLKKGIADTTLLKPFLNETYSVNYEKRNMYDKSKVEEVINDEAIIANQVQMYMLASDFRSAAKWSILIEDKYPMLRAVARCLGGKMNYNDPAEKESVELIKNSSPRNELIVNMFMNVYDSTTVSALQKLPVDEPLTLYLKAQRLCRQYKDVSRMSVNFDREEDPDFRHPEDKEVPLATAEDIEAQRAKVAEIESLLENDRAMGLDIDEFTMSQLEQARNTLAVMERGEVAVEPCACSVYSAAYNYLKQCFEKDKEFILTAKADEYICEELLNDVLGIETKKK